MHLRGHTTTFQTRLEISERAAAGLNDTQIATAVGCSIWTVRKWRRRSIHQDESASPWLGTEYTFNGTQDGMLTFGINCFQVEHG